MKWSEAYGSFSFQAIFLVEDDLAHLTLVESIHYEIAGGGGELSLNHSRLRSKKIISSNDTVEKSVSVFYR